MLFLIHLRMMFAFLQHHYSVDSFSLWSTTTPRSFSAVLLLRQSFPILYLYNWLILLKYITLHLFLLYFILFTSEYFSSLRSFWIFILSWDRLKKPGSSTRGSSVFCHPKHRSEASFGDVSAGSPPVTRIQQRFCGWSASPAEAAGPGGPPTEMLPQAAPGMHLLSWCLEPPLAAPSNKEMETTVKRCTNPSCRFQPSWVIWHAGAWVKGRGEEFPPWNFNEQATPEWGILCYCETYMFCFLITMMCYCLCLWFHAV